MNDIDTNARQTLFGRILEALAAPTTTDGGAYFARLDRSSALAAPVERQCGTCR